MKTSAAEVERVEVDPKGSAGHLPDEQVVHRVLAGETAMFELLMRRYNERLYRAARAITRDDREAEDVVQQAYVNAYTHLRQFKAEAQFGTWLTRIAVNEALARVRRRGRYEPFDEEQSNVETFMTFNPAPNPEQLLVMKQRRQRLLAVIRVLPEIDRCCLHLRAEGLRYREIAATLGISLGSVALSLGRSIERLRRVDGR